MVLFGRAVPWPEALAGAALAFREHRHLDRALAAVRLRHRADADEGARLDVGERRLADAEHRGFSVRLTFNGAAAFDATRTASTVGPSTLLDRAGDAHVAGAGGCAEAPPRRAAQAAIARHR